MSGVVEAGTGRVEHLAAPVGLHEERHVQHPLVHARLHGHVDDLLHNGLELVQIALGYVEEREEELELDDGVESGEALLDGVQLVARVLRDHRRAERLQVSGRDELVVQPESGLLLTDDTVAAAVAAAAAVDDNDAAMLLLLLLLRVNPIGGVVV